MNTMQLECFISVAEHLNFARAAEHLNISQPAVSHQINSLENELGTKLFKRTTRSVNLTPAGWNFMMDARSILDIASRAIERSRISQHEAIQLFNIGCTDSYSLHLLSKVLKHLTLLHPQVHPKIHILPFPAMTTLLREERIDVLLGLKEENERKCQGIFREISGRPVVCLLPEEHPLAQRSQVEPEDLAQMPMIILEPQQNSTALLFPQQKFLLSRSPRKLYSCDRMDPLVTLVKAGLGFAVVPDLFSPNIDGICRVPVHETDAVSFGIYYKTLQGNSILHNFLNLLEEEAKKA